MIQLTKEKALIFRVTHIDNLEWILQRGALEAKNHAPENPHMRSIGSEEVIRKRSSRRVPINPFGVLDDYVPFYFTPFSIMVYNIHTGFGEIERIDNKELIFFLSSLYRLKDDGISFVYTDRHAYMMHANYYSKIDDLVHIDWDLLKNRDFKSDLNDPSKKERYQAETLVYQRIPLSSLEAIVCYNSGVQDRLRKMTEAYCDTPIEAHTGWYF